MSVWNRLFGQSKSPYLESRAAARGRLGIESLESREVPSAVPLADVGMTSATREAADYSAIVFVGGWGASSYQYAFEGTSAASSDALPTDQFSLNYTKIEFATQQVPTRDSLSIPEPDREPVVTIEYLVLGAYLGSEPALGLTSDAKPSQAVPANQDFYYREFADTPTAPASDYLLVLDGIRGESHESHRGEIEIVSWSLGATASDPTTVADDVIVDGRIITAENPATSSVGVERANDLVNEFVAQDKYVV